VLSELHTTHRGIPVSYWRGGRGYPILMMHGSGPGASTLANWRLVLEPLAERYEIFGVDLIGFGKSGRKPNEPYFDVDLWVTQCLTVLDLMPAGEVGVIGQSLSGMLALRMAAKEPRIRKLLTTGCMGTSFQVNDALRRAWSLPTTRDEFREVMNNLVHDGSSVTDNQLEWRMRSLAAGGEGDYYGAMFTGDKQKYVELTTLARDELNRIEAKVVMIHGRNDKVVPFETSSLVLSDMIPSADLVVLSNCGHLPAVEKPQEFLAVARMLFG